MNRRRFITLLPIALAAAGCDAAAPRSKSAAKTNQEARSIAVASFSDDFAAALATAAQEQKPLLIFFRADWCSYCRQLRQDVFTRPEFAEASKRFVCVEVDAAQYPTRCEEYRVRAYPTLVIAAPSGAAIERIVGITTPAVVVAQMKAAATSIVAAREVRTEPTITR